MYTTLLTVRYRQLVYGYRQLSWFNRLLLLMLLVAAAMLSFFAFQQSHYALYVSGIVVAAALGIQLSRKDKHFLWLHLEQPLLAIGVEYACFSLPVTITALFCHQWYLFFAIQAGFFAVAAIRSETKEKASLIHLTRYLPATYFEWVSGIRKSRMFIIPVYCLALLLSWVPFLPLVLLWLCTAGISAFYVECEPLAVVQLHSGSSSQFLWQKLKKHLSLMVLLYAPILLIQLAFNRIYWLPPAFLLLQVLVIAFAIVYKYKLYQPNQMLQGNTVLVALVQLSSALPFLLPLPVIMLAVYYRPALTNLQHYIDD